MDVEADTSVELVVNSTSELAVQAVVKGSDGVVFQLAAVQDALTPFVFQNNRNYPLDVSIDSSAAKADDSKIWTCNSLRKELNPDIKAGATGTDCISKFLIYGASLSFSLWGLRPTIFLRGGGL